MGVGILISITLRLLVAQFGSLSETAHNILFETHCPLVKISYKLQAVNQNFTDYWEK